MTLASAPKSDGQSPASSPSLGHRAAGGFLWTFVQMLGTKLISLVAQVVLAYLLMPADWGVVGLVYTVVAFVNIFQQAGQQEMIIQWESRSPPDQRRLLDEHGLRAADRAAYRCRRSPCRRRLRQPPDGRPAARAGLSRPLQHRLIRALVLLQSRLRFRMVALIGAGQAFAMSLLSILFAFLGAGVYSFILPWPIVAVVRLAVLWAVARPPIRLNPQFRRWRTMLADSSRLLTANGCRTILFFGDYLILGLFHAKEAVGIYYFAYNFAWQMWMLLAINLDGVLFPSLSKLNDQPNRQYQGFITAIRLLALVGVPACFLQAALADPVLRLLFDAHKWAPAIPVLQVLSLGMALRLVGYPAQSLMQAQGRFHRYMILSLAKVAAFLICTFAAAILSDEPRAALSLAVGVALFFTFEGPLTLYVALRPSGGRWRDVWHAYAFPTLAGLITLGIPAAAFHLIPSLHGRHGLQLLIVPIVGLALYAWSIRRFAPQTWTDLQTRFRQFLCRT